MKARSKARRKKVETSTFWPTDVEIWRKFLRHLTEVVNESGGPKRVGYLLKASEKTVYSWLNVFDKRDIPSKKLIHLLWKLRPRALLNFLADIGEGLFVPRTEVPKGTSCPAAIEDLEIETTRLKADTMTGLIQRDPETFLHRLAIIERKTAAIRKGIEAD